MEGLENIKYLKDKGIPVIWRPLHEAAGNIYEPWHGDAWFWWGYDGAEVFKKLWIYMFEFFQAKGINNLIWVWNNPRKEGYVGDDYCDIVTSDHYPPAHQHTSMKPALDNLKNVTKNNPPKQFFCLGELFYFAI